jgi:hypothetical protein
MSLSSSIPPIRQQNDQDGMEDLTEPVCPSTVSTFATARAKKRALEQQLAATGLVRTRPLHEPQSQYDRETPQDVLDSRTSSSSSSLPVATTDQVDTPTMPGPLPSTVDRSTSSRTTSTNFSSPLRTRNPLSPTSPEGLSSARAKQRALEERFIQHRQQTSRLGVASSFVVSPLSPDPMGAPGEGGGHMTDEKAVEGVNVAEPTQSPTRTTTRTATTMDNPSMDDDDDDLGDAGPRNLWPIRSTETSHVRETENSVAKGETPSIAATAIVVVAAVAASSATLDQRNAPELPPTATENDMPSQSPVSIMTLQRPPSLEEDTPSRSTIPVRRRRRVSGDGSISSLDQPISEVVPVTKMTTTTTPVESNDVPAPATANDDDKEAILDESNQETTEDELDVTTSQEQQQHAPRHVVFFEPSPQQQKEQEQLKQPPDNNNNNHIGILHRRKSKRKSTARELLLFQAIAPSLRAHQSNHWNNTNLSTTLDQLAEDSAPTEAVDPTKRPSKEGAESSSPLQQLQKKIFSKHISVPAVLGRQSSARKRMLFQKQTSTSEARQEIEPQPDEEIEVQDPPLAPSRTLSTNSSASTNGSPLSIKDKKTTSSSKKSTFAKSIKPKKLMQWIGKSVGGGQRSNSKSSSHSSASQNDNDAAVENVIPVVPLKAKKRGNEIAVVACGASYDQQDLFHAVSLSNTKSRRFVLNLWD